MRAIAFILAFCAAVAGFGPVKAQANVNTHSVVVRGYGVGESEAVQDALYNAIRQVCGEKIASSSQIKSVSTDVNGKYDLKEGQIYEASSLTRGLISSYSVDNVDIEQATGKTRVTISARVPLYVADEQSQRLKIAVLPVSMGQSLAHDRDAESLSQAVAASLEAALVSSRRFAVIDRRQTELRSNELARLNSADVPLVESVRLGQELVAQYLTIAYIRTFKKTHQSLTTSSGRRIDFDKIQYEIDLRVIEVDTGQIKFAQSLQAQQSLFPPRGLINVATSVGEQMGELITNAVFPMVVIEIKGSNLTLNQGGTLVKPGQRYSIAATGAQLMDPYTKEILGLAETEIAVVEITASQDKIAKAKLISGTLPPQAPARSLLARRIAKSMTESISDFNRTIDAIRNGEDGKSKDPKGAW